MKLYRTLEEWQTHKARLDGYPESQDWVETHAVYDVITLFAQVETLQGALTAERARVVELEAQRGHFIRQIAMRDELIAKPPKHDFWGAGQPDCPREIKAGNGELHTKRCKVCGLDNPRDALCRAALTAHTEAREEPHDKG